MLILYFDPNCPFCQRVLQMADNLNVQLETKDVTDNEDFREELIEKGGEYKVPYLVDTEKDVALYESNEIIEYFRDNYAQTKKDSPESVQPRVHVSGSVCESCEG